MTCINDIGNGAMICARMSYEETELTVSVNGRAMGSLLETIMMFTEYFSDNVHTFHFKKLELFLKESDMHEGKEPWQVTHF